MAFVTLSKNLRSKKKTDEAATVGRKRGREGDEGESGERNRLVAGRLVGGPGDERCQAAAAAVRRHRGGGGKRGWLA